MNKSKIITSAFIQALGAGVYIGLISTFLNNAEHFFGTNQKALGSVLFILTFVISAAIMGMLVFGRAVLWYWDGKKKEAVILAIATVAFLILIAILVFVILVLNSSVI